MGERPGRELFLGEDMIDAWLNVDYKSSVDGGRVRL